MNAEQNLGLPPDQVETMEKALDMLKRISPVAWQLGHYAFRDLSLGLASPWGDGSGDSLCPHGQGLGKSGRG